MSGSIGLGAGAGRDGQRVVVIWEPGVLWEPAAGPVGHLCAGEQERGRQWRKRDRRSVLRPAGRPESAMGVGVGIAVPWEKCGRCEGLREHRVLGVRIEDVPGSELDLRMWPAESPATAGGRRDAFSWLFRRSPPWRGPKWPERRRRQRADVQPAREVLGC